MSHLAPLSLSATKHSDIDIAVDITGPMGLNFIAMADEIEALYV